MQLCRHFWVYHEGGGGLERSQTRLFYVSQTSHSYLRYGLFLYETWLILICDMTPSYMRHDAMHTWDAAHAHMRHDSSAYATWLILIWDMTHPRMRHDSFTYETQLIRTWDTTPSHMRHDSFTYKTRLIHMWDMKSAVVTSPYLATHWRISFWREYISLTNVPLKNFS